MNNLGVAMVGGVGANKRREHDYYETPEDAVRALLPWLKDWPRWVWEPACGAGAICRVLEAEGFAVEASDIVDRGWPRTNTCDFTNCDVAFAESVITNPPFKLASKFIECAPRMGVRRMALLLKMQFWNAATRLSTWQAWSPRYVLPLTWRLDFTGGGAPTMDCMWCVWDDDPVSETWFFPLARPVSLTETVLDFGDLLA